MKEADSIDENKRTGASGASRRDIINKVSNANFSAPRVKSKSGQRGVQQDELGKAVTMPLDDGESVAVGESNVGASTMHEEKIIDIRTNNNGSHSQMKEVKFPDRMTD